MSSRPFDTSPDAAAGILPGLGPFLTAGLGVLDAEWMAPGDADFGDDRAEIAPAAPPRP